MTGNEDKNLARQEPSTISSSSTNGDEESAVIPAEKNPAKGALISREEFFCGPLPPPQILAKYDDIQSGLADRIVAMAERQASHRQETEKLELTAQIGDDRLQRRETFAGQLFGFILSSIIITSAVIAVCLNPTWPVAAFSVLIGGGGIYAIILAFRYTKQVENADKTKPKPE